jgi:hypothetical protein
MKLRSPQELQFWREAPRIGLTGVAEIEIGERGVVAERVAYDLNLASDMLCRAWPCAEETIATGTLPAAIEPTLKIRSNMSKQRSVITPKNYLRPLKVLGEHAAVLASGEAP